MTPQPLKTEAIQRFLIAKTHPDLAARYNPGMEVQVLVAQQGGERIDGDFKGRAWHAYTDGLQTWKPIRIPWNAATDPEYTDTPMIYDLEKYADGIGLTGWNWQDRESLWVGYDFDAITGHSDQHAAKLTDAQLRDVQKAACDIPWVTVRRSTSGNGLHLYVYLDGFPTTNHTEHAAVARAIIGKMSAITGFPFHTKVDAMGHILWVWHRKMVGTNGLSLIKEGEILYDIPTNWREHIQVVKGNARKTMPAVIAQSPISDIEKLFDDLTSQRTHIPLDEEHRKLIAWLEENETCAYWDQDRHMLVTHTASLKRAHEELGLRGIFETMSRGVEKGDLNTFAFPMRRGAWALRRFTPGVAEHVSWTQDGQGWTQTYYHRDPDLDTAAKAAGGIESPKGGFIFSAAVDAVEAAKHVGVNIELPVWAQHRRSKLKEHRDGRLIVEIDHDLQNDGGRGGLPGWLAEGKTWSRVFHANLRPQAEVEIGNYDEIVRHMVTETGDDAGWVIRSEGNWVTEPLAHVKIGLAGALGLGTKEVTGIMGAAVFRNWRLVNQPFQPEYPGDRMWNRGAAQFRYHPTENRDDLQYPLWMRVLKHCGTGLDDAIKSHAWCKANGILSGGDYLKVWIASLFQKPMSPLPYLFLYSQEQNTGKSILHEALAELVTHGVARADQALMNQNGFNGELMNAVLCVVEEVDLSRSKLAYNRIKDWVTSRSLPIHIKGQTPFTIPNSSHWLQTANDHKFCPVFPGDTRITMVHVSPLAPEDLIPKERLLEGLRKEASDFMAEILALEIPQSNDRLNVPVVETGEKLNAQRANLTRLEAFIQEHTEHVTGQMIKFSEFVERFHEWLDATDIHEWSKNRVGKELPPHMPKGRRSLDGQWFIGNVSWEARKPDDDILPKLTLNSKDMLVSGAA